MFRLFNRTPSPASVRESLLNEFVELCKEEDLEPNEQKLRERFSRAPIDDVERVVDACRRFGVKSIISSL